MKKKLRIAIVHTQFSTLGGAENVLLWMADFWVKNGHSVSIFTFNHSSAIKEECKRLGIALRSLKLPLINTADHKMSNIRLNAWLLKGQLKHFDVINVHNFPATTCLGLALKNGADLPPIVWSCHEPPRDLYPQQLNDEYFSWRFNPTLEEGFYNTQGTTVNTSDVQSELQTLDQEAVRKIDKIVTNSQFTADNVKAVYSVDCSCFHFGVKFSDFSIHDIENKSDTVQIGLLSRLELVKNVPNVMKALQILKQQGIHNWTFNIAGEGTVLEDLKLFAKTLKIEKHLNFLGFLPLSDLSLYMQAQDFFVYLPFNEPLGLVPIEAAYYSKPSLVSHVGGPLETVQDAKTGLHANPNDVEDIAEKCRVLIQDEALRQDMGAKARTFVLENFDVERTAEHFESLFLDLTA